MHLKLQRPEWRRNSMNCHIMKVRLGMLVEKHAISTPLNVGI